MGLVSLPARENEKMLKKFEASPCREQERERERENILSESLVATFAYLTFVLSKNRTSCSLFLFLRLPGIGMTDDEIRLAFHGQTSLHSRILLPPVRSPRTSLFHHFTKRRLLGL